MDDNLVIVESPAKAKIIQKYLNNSPKLKDYGNFFVIASNGHIRVLDEKTLSIEINESKNLITPIYVNSQDNVISNIKKFCKKSKTIWLASDCDREGEAIAYHIYTTLSKEMKNKIVHRITFNEITQTALEEAILNPRDIDYKLVASQECRRVLDRLVGFKLSPQLWNTFPNESTTLSAGRVQSATLHILKDLEMKYNEYMENPSSYWNSVAKFSNIGTCDLFKGDCLWKVDTQVQAKVFLKQLHMKFDIIHTEEYETKVYSEKPFTTSSLQQVAYSKHGFNPKYTMQLAQILYEKGYITYMRTDSTYINPEFTKRSLGYIKDKYGTDYMNMKCKVGNKTAHEAIRPTHINNTKNVEFTPDTMKLYKLIWNRTIGYFMMPCVYKNYEIRLTDEGFQTDLFYKVIHKKIFHPGFMILQGQLHEDCNFDTLKNNIKELKPTTIEVKQYWEQPPSHYNDGTLIKKIDNLGIGRPSTYATILNKIYDKQYVNKSNLEGKIAETVTLRRTGNNITQEKQKQNIGKEKNKIVVTELGMKIDTYLESNFSYIVDSNFTANMEKTLDNIANGEIDDKMVLWNFWKKFKNDINKCPSHYNEERKTNQFIINDNTYIVRKAKYGPVIECTNPKKFINLTAYMNLFKKELSTINKEDIKLLTSLPKQINDETKLSYGTYGFYTTSNNRNQNLTKTELLKLL